MQAKELLKTQLTQKDEALVEIQSAKGILVEQADRLQAEV